MSDGPWPLALLQHTGSKEGPHFDLLLATEAHPAPQERCALTWRTAMRLHELMIGARVALVPIARHRACYLTLSEPCSLDQDRGTVAPMAIGRWLPLPDGGAELSWAPHASPMIVRFIDADGAVDARDSARLVNAIAIERRG